MVKRSASDVFVHEAALCESNHVGSGTRVWAFAHVMPDAHVGENCNICDHVFIESGVSVGDRVTIKNQCLLYDGLTIQDDVFVGPNVTFTNDLYPRSPRMAGLNGKYDRKESWLKPTVVERGATIGAGAVIVCGVRVGSFAMVGAGAVVTKDVPPHRLVVGQPAKPIGWVCVCGSSLGNDRICESCGRTIADMSVEVPICHV